MSEHVPTAVAIGLLVGVVLGLGFFGALLLTVRALPRIRLPGLLAVVSMLSRLALVAGGLFLLVDGGPPALGAALVGMLAARTWLVRRTERSARDVGRDGATWT